MYSAQVESNVPNTGRKWVMFQFWDNKRALFEIVNKMREMPQIWNKKRGMFQAFYFDPFFPQIFYHSNKSCRQWTDFTKTVNMCSGAVLVRFVLPLNRAITHCRAKKMTKKKKKENEKNDLMLRTLACSECSGSLVTRRHRRNFTDTGPLKISTIISWQQNKLWPGGKLVRMWGVCLLVSAIILLQWLELAVIYSS